MSRTDRLQGIQSHRPSCDGVFHAQYIIHHRAIADIPTITLDCDWQREQPAMLRLLMVMIAGKPEKRLAVRFS